MGLVEPVAKAENSFETHPLMSEDAAYEFVIGLPGVPNTEGVTVV